MQKHWDSLLPVTAAEIPLRTPHQISVLNSLLGAALSSEAPLGDPPITDQPGTSRSFEEEASAKTRGIPLPPRSRADSGVDVASVDILPNAPQPDLPHLTAVIQETQRVLLNSASPVRASSLPSATPAPWQGLIDEFRARVGVRRPRSPDEEESPTKRVVGFMADVARKLTPKGGGEGGF